MKNKLAQFIPIVLIFLLFAHSNKFAVFSDTILGKLIAVFIIMFYTHLDKIIGLFACFLVIIYYQSNQIENMLNMGGSIKTPTTNYKELYENSENSDGGVVPANIELIDQFRKQYCDGNDLKYKNMKVNQDMTEHVFPELKFKGDAKCNPCNASCNKFSIIESKLKNELEMMPKSSVN